VSALVPAAAVAAAAYALVPASISFLLLVIIAGAGIAAGPFVARVRAFSLLLCAIGGFIGLGCRVSIARSSQEAPPIPPSQITRIEGSIVSVSRDGDGRIRAEARVRRVSGENLSATARFTVQLTLAPETRSVIAEGVALSAAVDGVTEGSRGGWFARVERAEFETPPFLPRVRNQVVQTLETAIARSAGDGVPLMRALLLGERSDLTLRTEELFRSAGISHVLALSGMHLAVLAGLAVGMIGPLFGRRAGLVAGGVVALLYTLLIGGRPSLVRATLMSEISLFLVLMERPLRLSEIVAGAFLLHLVLQPSAIGEVSFQLSYLALLGIASVTPVLVRELRPWAPPAISGPLAAGLGAQIATSPVVLTVFRRLYPAGVLAAAVVGPLAVLFMIAGIAAMALSALSAPILTGAMSHFLSLLSRLIEILAWWFAGGPAIIARQGSAGMVAAGLSAGCIACGILIERRRLLWTGRR